VREALEIPVIANGNIRTLQDVDACIAATGCVGVMSAEAVLRDPSFFIAAACKTPLALALEFIQLCQMYNHDISLLHQLKYIKAICHRLLIKDLNRYMDLGEQLPKARSVQEIITTVHQLRHRVETNASPVIATTTKTTATSTTYASSDSVDLGFELLEHA